MRLTANVASLVLYEPPLPVGIEIYDPSLVARLEALLASGDRDALLTTFMREVPRVPAAHIDTMRSQDTWGARVAAAHTIPRELRAVNELEGGVRTRFAGMGVRTLLLVGGASPAFLTEASRVLAETLPDVRTVVFDGHGHSAMDTATAEFAEHVLAFAEGAAQR
jgi:pimeloyl-ACP methyl ester carboxylesterase